MTTWTAPFIAADSDADSGSAPILRREFTLDAGHGAVTAASLDVSALGVVEAWLGGTRVSDHLLEPGWTSYEWRIRVVSHDVTEHLTAEPGSAAVLALVLGRGWAAGRLAWGGGGGWYTDERAGFAELHVTFADGHVQTVATDTDWQALPSPITDDQLYDGQDVDARVDDTTWKHPGYLEHTGGVHTVSIGDRELVADTVPPVRPLAEIAPVDVWTSPSGATLVDFGVNLVGWVRVTASGPAGTVLTLRHAEVLEHDELGTRPLRTAKATDHLTLSGSGADAPDVFEPRFTFHGFRYAEVDGWPGSLDDLRAAVTAVQVGSDLTRTGTFTSSHELLNTFHENVVRGMQGNFLSVPTDCPQRDERLGWTGDIAAFAPTASYLFDTRAFLGDWLRDVWLEQQHADGVIPFVVPDVLKYSPAEDFGVPDATAIWSDAGVWVPWTLYQAYGDTAVLEEQFDSMTAHLRRIRDHLSPQGLWDTVFQFGDWLDPDAPPEDAAKAKADPGVVATVCAFRSATLVAEAGALLPGHEAETTEARQMAASLQAAFREHYVTDGRIRSDCTTVYALAIVFGILSDEDTRAAGDRLAELAAESGYRISTGFAGTPFITDALTQTGHLDDAYRLLLQTECPSWLYPVTMGATTVWERWDSMLPDGTINPGEMTSFNHYALGAVADWMHRVVGGLAPLTPGYETVLVAPQPGGGLTWAETTLDTAHGHVAVRWELVDGELLVRVSVPEGVTAVVRLPGLAEQRLAGGTHELRAPAAVPVP
ncbi:family 78 glycoside hydrolase catalytic domain [Curtobacterium sp. VKM Ac-2865]|uniref:family 78 glycoside hydrolase catalytic domain n=1 Tax=Curtobacterium sp. VKM Ac-2865 TaxID=2783817 RepID=UPI00188D1080|nr:family 78 glycoside hydrolase catalytic domain [Curtobacterium sp. VKM Ac-2865]MBF4583492.1 family 78 glycoside hydrolase catalytic domain [Curtobacterium sp. VKM Ac-2865]